MRNFRGDTKFQVEFGVCHHGRQKPVHDKNAVTRNSRDTRKTRFYFDFWLAGRVLRHRPVSSLYLADQQGKATRFDVGWSIIAFEVVRAIGLMASFRLRCKHYYYVVHIHCVPVPSSCVLSDAMMQNSIRTRPRGLLARSAHSYCRLWRL